MLTTCISPNRLYIECDLFHNDYYYYYALAILDYLPHGCVVIAKLAAL